jgi:hypothetical protein
VTAEKKRAEIVTENNFPGQATITNDGQIIDTATGEVITAVPQVSDDDLRTIGESGDAFADALALANRLGNVIDAGKELGTGFDVTEKNSLIGQAFIVLEARKNNDETTGRAFWSLTAVTKDGRKVIINDGGSGIAAQMDSLDSKHNGKVVPLVVAGGLRVSTYNHPEHGISSTFYLATTGADGK